ncbi:MULTISPECIES: hypothetical protein [unclassified Streptomyces]|uniref:hypothetical protein n=1 Tax=unclassified Streptomyces TaxID=2593676 RepID=UPI002E0F32AA|nr:MULTISPECIES: hypothetical protein [unclassified Streptomyces]WSR24944.1 hypothetical protein OG573_01605 [Streptomyces sp. NBC_01205]
MGIYEDTGAVGAPGRSLWEEEPARRRRMPDPVRDSAVRAVLIVAVTLTGATVAFFLMLTGSWLALPMGLSAIAGTVVATWGVLDVLITRQMWNQRNGVVSEPSSTARDLRRERRRARREARSEPGGGTARIPRGGAAAGARPAAWPPPGADRRYRASSGRS